MWLAQARDHSRGFRKARPAAEVGAFTAAPVAAEWRKTLVPAQQITD